MSLKEWRIAASMVTNAVIFVAFAIIIYGMYQDGRFDGEAASRLVGQSVLILIGVQIAGSIIANILVTIFHAIVTREEERDITDERDRIIELKGLRLSFLLFGVSFAAAIAALALGSTYFTAFMVMLVAGAVSDVAGNLWRLRLYRVS